MTVGISPSYAQHTASSRAKASPRTFPSTSISSRTSSARISSASCSSLPTTTSASPSSSPANGSVTPSFPPPRRFQTSHNFKTAYLSTSASRQRAISTGFRLFELPADVRNIVYAFHVRLHNISTWSVYLPSDSRTDDRKSYQKHALPLLLRVMNKQLREEVGSYYFTRNLLVWYVEDSHMSSFLKNIGRVNCEKLVNNRNAFVRVGEGYMGAWIERDLDRNTLEALVNVSKVWVSEAWKLDT